MLCESCKANPVEIEAFDNDDDPLRPYRLCRACHHRLTHFTLRPLEWFNLVATHGTLYYLHDDFYDYETGAATQPNGEVEAAERYPLPRLKDIQNHLDRLVDYAYVQWCAGLDKNQDAFAQIRRFSHEEILRVIDQKSEYSGDVHPAAYQIVGEILGSAGKTWLKKQLNPLQKEENCLPMIQAIVGCLDFDEAFPLITQALEKIPDNHLSDHIGALRLFHSERALDWMENAAHRIHNINNLGAWSCLAIASKPDWQRIVKWLDKGRPLSLIALEVLENCTVKDEDVKNLPLWKLHSIGKLTDTPAPEILLAKLDEYYKKDPSPIPQGFIKTICKNYSGF
jgi:hypothetical protein